MSTYDTRNSQPIASSSSYMGSQVAISVPLGNSIVNNPTGNALTSRASLNTQSLSSGVRTVGGTNTSVGSAQAPAYRLDPVTGLLVVGGLAAVLMVVARK